MRPALCGLDTARVSVPFIEWSMGILPPLQTDPRFWHILDLGGGRYRVGSTSRIGTSYLVAVLDDRAACNCPGSTLIRQCKHERQVLEMTQAVALREEEQEALLPIPVKPPKTIFPPTSDLEALAVISRNAVMAAGSAIPKGLDTPGKVWAVGLAGYELGVSFMVAVRHISIINGRCEPDAQLMMGLVRANDPTAEFRWGEVSSAGATVELWRSGKLVYTGRYTEEDANRAHQLQRPTRVKWGEQKGQKLGEEEFDGPWQTHTPLMMAYNAARLACKLGAADIINQIVPAYSAPSEVSLLEEGAENEDDAGVAAWERAALSAPVDERYLAQPGGNTREPSFEASAPVRAAQARNDEHPRNKLLRELREEQESKGVTAAQVAAVVGGPEISKVEKWLGEVPGRTVADLVEYAKPEHPDA